jgi:hypothetical protein
VDAEISPEPTEAERRAIVAALAAEDEAPAAYSSPWRLAALDDLGGNAAPEDPGRDAGVIEP